MESSGPSPQSSEVPEHRWHVFLGNIVGVLTLLIPIGVVGYFSYASNLRLDRNFIPESPASQSIGIDRS